MGHFVPASARSFLPVQAQLRGAIVAFRLSTLVEARREILEMVDDIGDQVTPEDCAVLRQMERDAQAVSVEREKPTKKDRKRWGRIYVRLESLYRKYN